MARFFAVGYAALVVGALVAVFGFSFGTTPFAFDFRPYIPRLYPRSSYTQVIHPDATGGALVTEIGDSCEFGCEVTNCDGTWFAEHDPITGNGMIVRHAPSPNGVALWIDVDGGSFTTASSMALVQPPGGFTGTVTDVQFLCFYKASIWKPSLQLPAGCQGALHKGATSREARRPLASLRQTAHEPVRWPCPGLTPNVWALVRPQRTAWN